MSRKILALIELDDDGTLHVTSGPVVHDQLLTRGVVKIVLPSWARAPKRREITIEPLQGIAETVIIHEREPGTPTARGPVSCSLLVNRLRWLVRGKP